METPTPKVSVLVSLLALLSIFIIFPGSLDAYTCYPDLPDPALDVTGTEDYTVSGGQQYTRYRLSVSNWSAFPDELFELSPDLPPCGLNTNASRTWVNIYSEDGTQIYGFCALTSSQSLANSLWFALPSEQVPPEYVYISLIDRRCSISYTSNLASTDVSVNQPPIADAGPDQTVMDYDPYGSEQVTLDGSGSIDPDGTIQSYIWREWGSEIASGSSAAVTLAVEVHTIVLTVTDNIGAVAIDSVVITVVANPDQYRIRVPDDYLTIQDAIDAASEGDTVIVADGTYGGTGNRNLDFGGKAITLRSENGPDNCIIDGDLQGKVFNFHSSESEASVVDGFTISRGYVYCDHSSPTITNCTITGNWSEWHYGGGIWLANSSATITKCTITGNTTPVFGGGIRCMDSSPTIDSCIITDNTSGEYGGGICCRAEHLSPVIKNCTIAGNTARYGGGLDIGYNTNAVITNCTIDNNTAQTNCGGGGIFCGYSSPTISNCIITRNTAEYSNGGGIFCQNSILSNDPPSRGIKIINCIIAGNTAGYYGGGICFFYYSPTITNCTIFGNTAKNFLGGGITAFYHSPTITNCILWSNTPDELDLTPISGSPIVTHSDIQGGYTGTGNIDADPLFVDVSDPDPSNWNLHLQSSSPCIDAGNNSAPEIPSKDFEGDPRIYNGDNDLVSTVDIGADEFVSGFTRIGTQVFVIPGPMTFLTFQNVQSEGYTSVETSPDIPEPDPSGTELFGPFYDITTTAGYTGDVTVSISYDESEIPAYDDEDNLGLFHLESTGWENVTTSVSTAQNMVIGRVSSFSWFALGLPELETKPVGLQPPLVSLAPLGEQVLYPDKAFKQGRTIPMKLELFSQNGLLLTDLDVDTPPEIVEISRVGDALGLPLSDLDAGNSNENSNMFRFSDDTWIYNFSTKNLNSGTYNITLQMPDGEKYVAGLVLR